MPGLKCNLCRSHFDRAVHAHDVFGSIVGLVVVESGKDAVRDLFDDQLIVGLALFALPENAARMPLHVLNVAFRAAVLLIGKCDGEAGFNSLCIHSQIW
jgi:hypothetical protein